MHFGPDTGPDHGRMDKVVSGDVDGDGRADVVVQLDTGVDVFLERNGIAKGSATARSARRSPAT